MPRGRAKSKKRSLLTRLLSTLLICCALVLGVSVFFKVSYLRVEGETRYTPEEVAAASGISNGDNLFFVNKFTAINRIFKELPYADTVTMRRELPNVIVITISDTVALGYLRAGDSFWLVDKYCKLLENVGGDEPENYIEISGVDPIQPVAGQKIAPGESEKVKTGLLSAVLTGLEKAKILDDVTWLDVSSAGSARFDYLGRFTVEFGDAASADVKLERMLRAVADLTPVARGTINLTWDTEARFIPD